MNSQQDKQKTKRLFFALWPGHRNRDAIYKVAKALKKQTGGRLVQFENLHLTLAFIGSVNEQQQRCMEHAASKVNISPFEIVLSELGYWPKPRVAWLGCKQQPGDLLQLVAQLNTRLEKCGYQPDDRPFQAHITLLRKATHHPKDTETRDISWSVDRFALVESVTHAEGVEYQVIAEWPLA